MKITFLSTGNLTKKHVYKEKLRPFLSNQHDINCHYLQSGQIIYTDAVHNYWLWKISHEYTKVV